MQDDMSKQKEEATNSVLVKAHELAGKARAAALEPLRHALGRVWGCAATMLCRACCCFNGLLAALVR